MSKEIFEGFFVFNAMAWIYKSSLTGYVSVENEKNFDS